jgi:hypothetical protein
MTNAPSLFLGEVDFTQATQNRDYGAPSSQRITVIASPRRRGRGGGTQHHLALRSSTSSIQSGSESSSSYAHGYPNILLLTRPPLSMMCNGCMSGRVQNSTPCWSPNGKQPAHGRANLGRLQDKLDGKSSYRAHVGQRLPYSKLYLDDASISCMYFELIY